jgi:G3E family GTPase
MSDLQMQLQQVQRQVEEAERRIEDQIAAIDRLVATGLDTRAAEDLLETLVGVLDRVTERRDILERASPASALPRF